ncbi:MAG: protein kinase [Nannocystaceae bacterium]
MHDSSATTMAGTVLDGRYRVLRLLKAGGMGTVYEGEQLRLGKRVAIKVLRPEATYNELARRRFEREAQLASRIHHRNVVELIDFGVQDDTAYYVMELLVGRDLSSLLEEHGRLPWDRARSILLQLARGLAAAHRLGIIHRDVKPGNCFLVASDEPDDEGDRVKVLDFGIAKLDPTFGPDGGLTRTSQLVGTVAYMSPEQAQSQPVDARSDVYSLGILAYQVLTGQRPFRDDNVFNVLLKHMNEAPQRPRSLEPSIPEPVEAAILQALNKDPAARFPSMDAFRAALSSVTASLVGVATSIFLPDVDGAATIPLSRDMLPSRPGAELGGATRVSVPDEPAQEPTRIHDPHAQTNTQLLAPPPTAEPGGTTVAPHPSGPVSVESTQPAVVQTIVAPAPSGPQLLPSGPTSVVSSVSLSPRAASDHRLLAAVVATVVAVVVAVGIGIWLAAGEDQPTPVPRPAGVFAPGESAAVSPPTPEAPTPEAPTPEAPTPEAPTPEALVPLELPLPLEGPREPDHLPPLEQPDLGPFPDEGDVDGPAPSKRVSKSRSRPTDATVLAKLRRRAKKRCASPGAAGTVVRVSLSIDPQGAVTLARPEAPHGSSELGRCVRAAVSDDRFPGTGDRRVLALVVTL